MRWDWYAATLPAGVDEVFGVLSGAAELVDVRPARPMHGYERGAELARGERVLCRALWGGCNGPDTHAWASGQDAEWFAGVVRGAWPQHRVTRADSAADFSAPGAWERLSGMVLEVADRYRVQVTHHGDWHRGELGRTLWIGSRQSVAQLVVYEKGRQLGVDPHWVRLEARVKPRGPGRELLASASPFEVWGCTAYLREVGEQISSGELAALRVGTVYRTADDARAWASMVRQYGPTLTAAAAELGGWAQVGLKLGEDIERHRSRVH